MHKPVALIDDDFKLKKIWILYLNKCTTDIGRVPKEWEFIKEVHYDHYPTEEEIIYQLCTNNLSYDDYIQIEEGWQKDW